MAKRTVPQPSPGYDTAPEIPGLPPGTVPWPGGQQDVSTGGNLPRRRRQRAGLVLGATVTVALAALLIVALSLHSSARTHSGQQPKVKLADGRSTSANTATPVHTTSPTPANAPTQAAVTSAPAPRASSAADQLPTLRTPINVTAVRGSQSLPEVARLFDTYFTGINRHEGRDAASTFVARGSIDPHNLAQVHQFSRDIRTTHDDEITIHSIRVGSSGGVVVVTFRSRQAAGLGPDGEACTLWNLHYNLEREAGQLKLLDSRRVVHQSC